tara:strand:- start:328 stop:579 length:252 start_codon:yes stop_codon:yes gene_type:complete
MLSLLTEQLVNFDYDTHNQINIKKSYNTIENNIEKKLFKKYDYLNQCSLIIHTFNPSKNSPPNEWQFRLIKRINSLNSFSNQN